MIYLFICFATTALIFGSAMIAASIDVKREIKHAQRIDYADQIIKHCLSQIESE